MTERIKCGNVDNTAGKGHGCGGHLPHYAIGLCHPCYRKLARLRHTGECDVCRDGRKTHILHTTMGTRSDGTPYGLCEKHYMEDYRARKKVQEGYPTGFGT